MVQAACISHSITATGLNTPKSFMVASVANANGQHRVYEQAQTHAPSTPQRVSYLLHCEPRTGASDGCHNETFKSYVC